MKLLYLVIIFFVIASIAILFREYFRKPEDAVDKVPEIKIEASKLITAFEENEEAANKIYLGKWLDVSGNLIRVDTTDKANPSIVLGDTNNLHNVHVELAAEASNNYLLNETIVVRGFCTGYLMDVQLNQAAIIDK